MNYYQHLLSEMDTNREAAINKISEAIPQLVTPEKK
jgi:hypothetical protein